MEYRIRIKLLSDLCSASGSTGGRSVDTDVCKDKDGYPYIPGKRLKGVLLQGYLDYVDLSGEEDRSEAYFGEEDGDNSCMYVGDALLLNKDSLSLDDCFLERTRTRVDEDSGVASEGSLRTFAICPKGLEFLFSLETSMEEEALNSLLRLVSHIGLGRNRGLGHVQMEIKSKGEKEASPISLSGIAENETYVCTLLCRLENNLLLPSDNANLTEERIPGSTLSGFFAHRYLSLYHPSDPMEDSDFVSIFLKGRVNFSFGFVSDEEGHPYYPLPQCVQKVKNGDKYRLFLPHKGLEIPEDQLKQKYKALSGRYGSFNEKEVSIQEIYHIFEYHHQRDKEAMGKGLVKDESFFQYDSLAKGQYFSFSLTGKGSDLKKLLTGLTTLHLGRSRSAQYGSLKVAKATLEAKKEEKGQSSPYYLAWVETPLILSSHYPEGKLDDPLLSLLGELLNESYPGLAIHPECRFFSTEKISGFNILWKKRKPTYEALSAGSYFLLENPSSLSLPKVLSLGKKGNEGYGKVSLLPLPSLPEKPEELTFVCKETKKNDMPKGRKSTLAQALDSKNAALEDFGANAWLKNLDHGLLGRLLAMLRDCKDYPSFRSAIDGIEDKQKKLVSEKLLGLYKNEYAYQPYFFTLLTLIKYAQRKEGKE